MKNHKILRWSALFEGTSFLALLFVAVPLKYMTDIATGVRIIGPIHGVLFLALITLLLLTYLQQKINVVQLLIGIVASVLPFGTFVYTAKCLSSEDSA